MKGTFNQGWWNCFESFAAELHSTQNAEDICISVLTGAAITRKEASAWLDKPVQRNPKVEAVVRKYWLK